MKDNPRYYQGDIADKDDYEPHEPIYGLSFVKLPKTRNKEAQQHRHQRAPSFPLHNDGSRLNLIDGDRHIWRRNRCSIDLLRYLLRHLTRPTIQELIAVSALDGRWQNLLSAESTRYATSNRLGNGCDNRS